MIQLTQNAVSRILATGVEKPHEPILQVVDLKKMPGSKYKSALIDGNGDTLPTIFSSQLSPMLDNGEIEIGSVILLDHYLCNEVQGKPIIIITQVRVLGINPVSIQKNNNADPNASYGRTAPAPVPQYNQNQGYSNPAPVPPSYVEQSPYSTGAYGSNQSGGGYASSYGGMANSRPVVRDAGGGNYMPISALNPYANRWTIKARVTSKSDLKTWANNKGEGTLFSIDLLDSQGSEIRATFFKETAQKYFSKIQEGKVYTFSGGKLKIANKQYSSIKNNYEITFDQNSEIIEVNLLT